MKETKTENILKIVEMTNLLSDEVVRDLKNVTIGLMLKDKKKKLWKEYSMPNQKKEYTQIEKKVLEELCEIAVQKMWEL